VTKNLKDGNVQTLISFLQRTLCLTVLVKMGASNSRVSDDNQLNGEELVQLVRLSRSRIDHVTKDNDVSDGPTNLKSPEKMDCVIPDQPDELGRLCTNEGPREEQGASATESGELLPCCCYTFQCLIQCLATCV
jgi:hypothetical protein